MSHLKDGNKIAVIGGDDRMFSCAKCLANRGIEVAVFGFDNKEYCDNCTKCLTIEDAILRAKAVVLPLPVSADGKTLFMTGEKDKIQLMDVFSKIADDCIVLGGNISEEVSKIAAENNVKILDYFQMEELKIANAYLTAESAIAIALNEIKTSIKENNVLVLGYGRIGKMLCQILKAMNVNVFASARKNRDFAWIRAYGYSPVDTSRVDEVLSTCNIVFNTIPESILSWDRLCLLDKDCLVIDLASKPGGVDFDAAKVCGIKVIWALGLPGKMKEKSAGKAIADTVVNIMEDEVNKS